MPLPLPLPVIDVFVPRGALSPQAEKALLARLTDIALLAAGLEATSANRHETSVFLHRPAEVYAPGTAGASPGYLVFCSVAEGELREERRSALVADVRGAVLDAEHAARRASSARVWVFATEVPAAESGSRRSTRRIRRLAGMMGFMIGDPGDAGDGAARIGLAAVASSR
jgi:phenylpyruvate tautomerase PptA (4-oxalocrotonate tautomerase family)